MMISNRSASGLTACAVPARMEVIFPEQTFRPQPFEVTIIEASRSGARVQADPLTRDSMRLIMRELRYARLILSEKDEDTRLYGRIVWIGRHGPQGTQLGLTFDSNEKGVKERLDVLMRLAEKNPPETLAAAVEEAAKSPGSWVATISAVAPPPKQEDEGKPAAPKHPSKPGGEGRRAIRVRCSFPASFQFQLDDAEFDREEFDVVVLDVSWTGAKIRLKGERDRALIQKMRAKGINPFKLARTGKGWLSLQHAHQKFSAYVSVVWCSPELKLEDGGWAMDIGLSIEGSEAETKFVRTALLETAQANPAAGE